VRAAFGFHLRPTQTLVVATKMARRAILYGRAYEQQEPLTPTVALVEQQQQRAAPMTDGAWDASSRSLQHVDPPWHVCARL
jgi:hypothetical protein